MPVLRARVLTPVSPDAVRWLSDAIVVVGEGGTVEHVGPADGRRVDLDLRPGVLVPGFVDAHLHYPQTRIVGAATGPLLDWLARSTFPEEARFADRGHAERVAEIFAASLAAAGTTLPFVYGPVFPQATDALLEVLDRRGQRAIAGPVWMDEHSPEALCLPVEAAVDGLEALADRWHGHDGRFRIAVIPRFALSCSPGMLRRGGDLSRARGLWASTHLSENVEETRIARERFGAPDYLRVYEDAGLLHGRSVFAHCIHLSDDEWDRFAANGAVVAHCPDSNAFLGSGHMPVREVLDRGIRVAAGTDVAAGRSFRVQRTLSFAYDNALVHGLALDPRRLLWWGTRGGALALGHDHVGAIEPGLDADLACFDVPEWVDGEDAVLATLLFDLDAPRPRYTWVRGRVVWDRDAAGAWPWWPVSAGGRPRS